MESFSSRFSRSPKSAVVLARVGCERFVLELRVLGRGSVFTFLARNVGSAAAEACAALIAFSEGGISESPGIKDKGS